MKRHMVSTLLLGSGLLGAAASLTHPFGAVKAQHTGKPLLEGAVVSPIVMATIQRSCGNCHSEKTEWPWYSYVAPASWMVERDVRQARSHMDLSLWNNYDDARKQEILAELAAVVRNRKMPLPRYTLLHTDAKLSDADIERIYQWAKQERRRLKTRIPYDRGNKSIGCSVRIRRTRKETDTLTGATHIRVPPFLCLRKPALSSSEFFFRIWTRLITWRVS
jgi:heme-binding protein